MVSRSSSTGSLSKLTQAFWPDIIDERSARAARQYGIYAAGFVAMMTAVASLSGIGGANLWSLIDAALFAAVAFGIYRMSRFAAVAGLALYVLEKVMMWIAVGLVPMTVILPLILTLAFIHSVRGTWFYRRSVSRR